MWLRRSAFWAWLFGIAISFPASAANIVELRLTPDDRAMPPVDRLHLAVLLLPGEQSALVEVRAAHVLGKNGESVEPVARRHNRLTHINALQPEPRPEYVARCTIIRPLGTAADLPTLVSVQFAVLHADLQLPDGPCQLAYEVRVAGPDGTVFAQPTPTVDVLITDRGRVTLPAGQPSNTDDSFAAVADSQSKPAPAAPLSNLEPVGRRLIYYATNRNVLTADASTVDRFGSQRAVKLSFGASQVNIPVESHRVGNLEGPMCNWWSRAVGDHFCVEKLSPATPSAFAGPLSGGDVLLFVHGFNNSLEDALLRTAQLRHDMEFPGAAVAFSWPSKGGLFAYSDDELQASESVSALANLLETLMAVEPAKSRVHVLAHSMGNRLLLEAVAELVARKSIASTRQKLGCVMLTAADVDRDVFARRLPVLLQFAQRVTYYYSAEDVALTASRRVYGNQPVGLSPWFAATMDTINADNANSAWVGWGHRYYAGSDRVLLDINLLVNRSLEPKRRQPPLRPDSLLVERNHWLFADAK